MIHLWEHWRHLVGQVELRQPWFLLFALVAPMIFVIARMPRGRLLFSSLRLLPARSSSWRIRFAWLPVLGLSLAAAALALAMAGPRLPKQGEKIRKEGIAIMMAVDVSGSMMALDLDPQHDRTRLDVVRDVFTRFVRGGDGLSGRPNDAVGIVSFAGFADTRCPLTLDHHIVSDVAHDLEIVKDRSEDGTALGDGLGLAVERLHKAKAKSKVVILLTDGVNNAGQEDPVASAELAKKLGVKVYTIGAGTNGFAPVATVDPFSGRKVLRQMQVQIDEDTLRTIAEATGGQYFRATDGEALKNVYEQIDRLERTEVSEERYREYTECYSYAVGVALLLAALSWLGQATIWRRLP